MRKCNHHAKIALFSFLKQFHKRLHKDAEQPQKVSQIIFLATGGLQRLWVKSEKGQKNFQKWPQIGKTTVMFAHSS